MNLVVEQTVIPVVTEELELQKRTDVTGVVRIVKTVREREELVDVSGVQSRVNVETVPVNRIVETHPAVRQEGDVTIYPVVEEVVIVTRHLLLKEEVRVWRESIHDPRTETVTLRSEDVVVGRVKPSLPLAEPPFAGTKLPFLEPFKNGEITLSETSEYAFAAKAARVTEEVVIRKERSQRSSVVRDTLRSTEIAIESIEPIPE